MNEISSGEMAQVRQSTSIPSDLDKFKAWADRECVHWPADMQIEAYRAWASGDLGPFKALWEAMKPYA